MCLTWKKVFEREIREESSVPLSKKEGGMSRPDRNEKHHLQHRITAQQYQLLCRQAQKCGLTKRAFLVRLIEGRPVKARPAQEIKDLRTEIHHIGNNINQIARSVNAGIARPEDAKRGAVPAGSGLMS